MERRTRRAGVLGFAAGALAMATAAPAPAAFDPERDATARGIAYHVYPSVAPANVESTLAPNNETPADIEVVRRSPLRFAVVAYAASADPNNRFYNRRRALYLEDGSLSELLTRVRQAGQRILDLERVQAGGIEWAAVTVQSGFLDWDVLGGNPTPTFNRMQKRGLAPIDIERRLVVAQTSNPNATPPTEWRLRRGGVALRTRLYELRTSAASLSDIERVGDGLYDVLIPYNQRNPLIRYDRAAKRAVLSRAVYNGSFDGLRARVDGGALRVLDLETYVSEDGSRRWLALLTRN